MQSSPNQGALQPIVVEWPLELRQTNVLQVAVYIACKRGFRTPKFFQLENPPLPLWDRKGGGTNGSPNIARVVLRLY